MGRMFYGMTEQAIEMEDRLLAHVQSVVLTKLRRGESFSISWKHDGEPVRETIWVHSSIPLRIVLDDADAGSIDRDILVRLVEAANSNRGMDLSSEALADMERAIAESRVEMARAA